MGDKHIIMLIFIIKITLRVFYLVWLLHGFKQLFCLSSRKMDGLPAAGSLWCDQTLRVCIMFSVHLLKLHRTWLCLVLTYSYLFLLCVSYYRHVFFKLWVASLFLVDLSMTRIAMFPWTPEPRGETINLTTGFQAGKVIANKTQQHNKNGIRGGKGVKEEMDWEESCKLQKLRGFRQENRKTVFVLEACHRLLEPWAKNNSLVWICTDRQS